MSQYYAIRIGMTYLTSDGTSGGLPARCLVPQWPVLVNPHVGVSMRANSGRPIRQVIVRPPGDRFQIQIETWLAKSVWQAIKAAMDAAVLNNTTITVVGTGDTGNFTKTAKPALDTPYDAEGFDDERIIRPFFWFETA